MKHLFIILITVASFYSCSSPSLPELSPLEKEIQSINERILKDPTAYAISLPSGVRMVVTTIGKQPPAHAGQTVVVKYVGKLFDTGSAFEADSVNTLFSLLKTEGLRQGISTLLAGSKATIYVPSQYAYGTVGTSKVPPNSIVVYEVDFISATRTTEEQAVFTKDTTAIQAYLADSAIANVIKHPSGICYTIDSAGKGDTPKNYDAITMDYEATVMRKGTLIDYGTLRDYGIFNLIDGLKIGLGLLPVGTKATFYIPSGMAYGTTGATTVPANAILVFKINLLSYKKN